jgi:F0F1-type ATP synthase membrane subunit b/b'
MSRALAAAFKSQIAAQIDRHHLDPDEVVQAGAVLIAEHARKAGLDRRAVHALVDDALAAAAVEGTRGAE